MKIILLGFVLLAIILKILFEVSKIMDQNEMLDEVEKQQPNFNYYKVLPHKVKKLIIRESDDGRYNLVFTPISIKQIDEVLFLIGVKAKVDQEYISFDLVLNGEVQKMSDFNSEVSEFNIVGLDTNKDDSDGLLRVLSHLFNVEISNNSQIIRSVVMLTEKSDINIETIRKPRQFTAYFADNKSPIISPSLDFFIDIEKGEIMIQEIDKLFRPIIINKLLFKANIKS